MFTKTPGRSGQVDGNQPAGGQLAPAPTPSPLRIPWISRGWTPAFSVTGWGIDLDYCDINGLPWKQTEIILSFLRLHPSTAFGTLLLTMMATPWSDTLWSTGEVNGKPLQYSCLENPMNSMQRQNDRILKEEHPGQ